MKVISKLAVTATITVFVSSPSFVLADADDCRAFSKSVYQKVLKKCYRSVRKKRKQRIQKRARAICKKQAQLWRDAEHGLCIEAIEGSDTHVADEGRLRNYDE